MSASCSAATRFLSCSPASFRLVNRVVPRVMLNASPRVLRRRPIAVSIWPVSASSSPARRRFAVTFWRSASWLRSQARSVRSSRVSSASASALSISSGFPGAAVMACAVGQGGVADVLDLADIEPTAHDLGDEPGFAFDGLPHVAVEGALGNVSQDLHFVVVVALAQDAALALGDVGGPPRAVEMVEGEGGGTGAGATVL